MNFEQYLPPGVTPEDVLVLMSALSALLVTVTVWFSLLHRDPAMKRARLMARERKTMRAGIMGPRRRNERLPTISMMRQIVDRLNLLRSSQADKISQKLMRAGWRSKDAIIRYLFFKLALPFAFAGIAVFFVYGANLYGLSPTMKLVVTILSVLVGAFLPDMIVKNAAQKRRDKIRKALPDGLDLMVICAEAGLSLDATLMRVSREMEQASPELADELSLTGLELGFLTDRRKALKNLALRVDLLAVRGVVNTLLQAERYGTPLAQSLRVMSAESRQERVMKAEEKAARLPAMLTVPMMVFIVLLGPAVLDIIDNFANVNI